MMAEIKKIFPSAFLSVSEIMLMGKKHRKIELWIDERELVYTSRFYETRKTLDNSGFSEYLILYTIHKGNGWYTVKCAGFTDVDAKWHNLYTLIYHQVDCYSQIYKRKIR